MKNSPVGESADAAEVSGPEGGAPTVGLSAIEPTNVDVDLIDNFQFDIGKP